MQIKFKNLGNIIKETIQIIVILVNNYFFHCVSQQAIIVIPTRLRHRT